MCDRRRGVGADGVLLLESDPELDFAMRYHNADGRAAAYCGNGARCLARFALSLGLGKRNRVRFRTAVGLQRAHALRDGRVEVHFGRVEPAGDLDTVTAAGQSFTGRAAAVGVPHFVVGVSEVAPVRVATWGAAVRGHRHFAPAGTNVDFVAAAEPGVPRPAHLRTRRRGRDAGLRQRGDGGGAVGRARGLALAGARADRRRRHAGGRVRAVRRGFDVRLTGPAAVAFTGVWETGSAAVPAERTCSKD